MKKQYLESIALILGVPSEGVAVRQLEKDITLSIDKYGVADILAANHAWNQST